MPIKFNLIEDWENIQLAFFKKYLAYWGFTSKTLDKYLHEPKESIIKSDLREAALVVWFNYQRRLIKQKPRVIHSNPALSCPPELASGWKQLQKEVTDGEDLTPRLSRKIENADYNDRFLNEWGFYHFHLGIEPDDNHPRLKKGGPVVLVAIVDNLDFYPVTFLRHLRWHEQSILENAIAAYPKYFERYRLKGISNVFPFLTDDQMKQLRDTGVNVIRRIGNSFYCPPGMGMMTTGSSIIATAELDQRRKWLTQIEEKVKEQFGQPPFPFEITIKTNGDSRFAP